MSERTTRVLVVDDDEGDYVLTRELLSDIGGWRFHLDWVSTYDDARRAISCQEHDLYLVDYRLGARDGLDLIREASQSGGNRPMMLMTGLDDHEVDIKAAEAGAFDYLVKGKIDASALERSIRYAIQRAEAADALRGQ